MKIIPGARLEDFFGILLISYLSDDDDVKKRFFLLNVYCVCCRECIGVEKVVCVYVCKVDGLCCERISSCSLG